MRRMLDRRKQALLLGGTGAMGVYLAPILEDAGWEVDVTTRKERASASRHCQYIQGNAKDAEFLKSVLSKGYDAVIDFMVYRTEEFACRRDILLEATSHYVFLSSYRVYGDSKGNPICEESPRLLDSVDDKDYLATDEYGLTKARQEDILKSAKQSNWTIVRPAITYSKERFQLGTMEANEFLHRALKHKPIVFPKEMLDKQATMTWAGDVAKMISLLLLNNKTYGEAFTASTSEHHSWKDVLEIYRELLDFKVKFISLEEYERAIGRPYQIKYDRMLDRVVDNSKILKATGMHQSDLMPLKDGLNIELTSFSKSPKFAPLNKKFESAVERTTLSTAERLCKKVDRYALSRRSKTGEDKTSKVPNRACILTIQGHENYGCILQNYALQEKVRELGFDVYTLNLERQRPFKLKESDVYHRNCYEAQCNQMEFVDSHIALSPMKNKNDIAIVGSDQVWNPFFNKNGRFWAKGFEGKKIAYAASFGDKNNDDLSDAYKGAVSYFVPGFNSISVREPEGVRVVKANANKDSQVVCDPTLLQDRSFYEKLIQNTQRGNRFWFGYMIKDERLEENAKKKAAELGVLFNNYNMYREVLSNKEVLHSEYVGKRYPKVEEWLGQIRDSELVLTSSFHAVVFSLLLHSAFFYLMVNGRIDGRIKELLEQTGTQVRAIASLDEIDIFKTDLIDWQRVDECLAKMRRESSQWLEMALAK